MITDLPLSSGRVLLALGDSGHCATRWRATRQLGVSAGWQPVETAGVSRLARLRAYGSHGGSRLTIAVVYAVAEYAGHKTLVMCLKYKRRPLTISDPLDTDKPRALFWHLLRQLRWFRQETLPVLGCTPTDLVTRL